MNDDIRTDKKYYYVSVMDGDRRGLLLGPYNTHVEALENVDRGKSLALKHDCKAWFYGYGTAGSNEVFNTVFGI